MNIEKVKNYNQKMLAVFITIIVGIAAIGLISFIVFLFSEIIPNNKPDTNTLLSEKKLDQLKKDSLRQQIISYNTPELVDTTSLLYLIPVNVKTLTKPEKMDKQVLGILDVNKEAGYSSSRFNTERSYYGSFNNILLYDFKNNQSRMIVGKRIIGSDLQYKYFDDEIILTFTGSEYDTDLDNQITLKDLQDLFIYSLKDRVLKQLKQPNSTVESYKFVTGEKDILITFGYDRDKNNNFDIETEPTYVMRYNFKTGEIQNIVDKNLESEIQAIIDKK
jgi:hypothetical protein